MASKFAEELVGSVRAVLRDDVTRRQVKTAIDISMLKVAQVLGHARYRNHDHNPEGCSQCEGLERVAENLRIP